MKKVIYIVIVLIILIVCFGCATTSKTKEEREGVNQEVFFQSVRSGDYAEVKRLIKAGADGNAQSNDGSKALIIVALQYGHPEVAQLLIEAGAK